MTDMKTMQFSLAPDKLWQSINPWSFYNQGAQIGLINIDLGITPRPDIEEDILEQVGSYGRQLGWIGDATEVLLNHVPLDNLDKEEQRAITIVKGRLAEIAEIKQRHGRNGGAEASQAA